MKKYFDFAENDYLFLQDIDTTKSTSYNNFCSLSQSVCERFLKHIVEEFIRPTSAVEEKEKEDVLKTHSLRKLCGYLKRLLPGFVVNTSLVYKAEGFYFSVRYPSNNSFFAELDDVMACKEAVEECRSSVKLFLELDHHNEENSK